jgi:GNAT superfamily N-acetyltransferase
MAGFIIKMSARAKKRLVVMGYILSLEHNDRRKLDELFSNHKLLRFLILTVLEGRWGLALADNEYTPHVGLLIHNPIAAFFGGNPKLPISRKLVQELTPPYMIYFEPEGWRDLLLQEWGERLVKRQRFDFSCKSLDINRIRAFKKGVPEGVTIKRLNLDLTRRLNDDLMTDHHLLCYDSPTDFIRRGFGFCALSGERIVSCASSFTVCSEGIDIEINTHPDFRRRGLATVLAATLIEHCLECGIIPHWDAANPISFDLAEKLGYTLNETYDCYILVS